jgi:hypothetical protein
VLIEENAKVAQLYMFDTNEIILDSIFTNTSEADSVPQRDGHDETNEERTPGREFAYGTERLRFRWILKEMECSDGVARACSCGPAAVYVISECS